MQRLTFLGLTCLEAKPGEFAPPASLPSQISIPEWSVTLANNVLTAKKGVINYGSATQVAFNLILQTRTSGTNVTLVDGNHTGSDTISSYFNVVSPVPKNPHQTPGMILRCGPLLLLGKHSQNWIRSTNGQLAIAAQEVDGFPLSPYLPVQLLLSRDANLGFIAPDLGNGRISILEKSITLWTSTPAVDAAGQGWQGQALPHQSETILVDLWNPAAKTDLLFSGNSLPLPLHVEQNQRGQPVSSTNRLEVPLTAGNYRLRLLLSRAPDSNNSSLLEMAIQPTNAAQLTLTTSALAGIDNTPKVWTISGLPDDGLKLRMRIADATRCGTLLLDQRSTQSGAPLPLGTATPIVIGSLHTPEISDTVIQTGTSNAELRCQVFTKHQLTNSDGTPYPGGISFPDSVLAEGTAPHVVWQSTNTEQPSFTHARVGATYRNSDAPVKSAIDTLNFNGASTSQFHCSRCGILTLRSA